MGQLRFASFKASFRLSDCPNMPDHQLYKLSGDLINSCAVLSSILLFVSVIYSTQPVAQRDGFCIDNAESPYGSSFYVDYVGMIILVAIWCFFHALDINMAAMESSDAYISAGEISTTGHLCAHFSALSPFSQILVGGLIVWSPFLRIIMFKKDINYTGLMALIMSYLQGFSIHNLQFVYVLAITWCILSLFKLVRSTPAEKHRREYMATSMLCLSVILVAWIGVLYCAAFFRSFIVIRFLSFILFCIDCYLHINESLNTCECC